MPDLRTAAQQALEALEKYRHMMFVEAGCRFGEGDEAITTLKAALAEPVATQSRLPLPGQVAALKAERDALLEALKQFAECELNEGNCASFEVANRRIRYVARAAIAKAEEKT